MEEMYAELGTPMERRTAERAFRALLDDPGARVKHGEPSR
jgi:hypothetical protein